LKGSETLDNQKPLFLIVDDEPDMCWALEHLLERSGLPSKKAFSGREALALTESTSFSLAFLDAKLPDMDGIELARRMRRLDPSLPIIMISGYFYREDEAVQEALSLGLIHGFISKPFLHDEVMRIIEIAHP